MDMCVDMKSWRDMHTDISINACMDMCVGMCLDTFVDTRLQREGHTTVASVWHGPSAFAVGMLRRYH